jgi:hypothetical protein
MAMIGNHDDQGIFPPWLFFSGLHPVAQAAVGIAVGSAKK